MENPPNPIGQENEITPPKGLQDLPANILTGIFEYLDLNSLYSVQKVSRQCRQASLDIVPPVSSIEVYVDQEVVSLEIGELPELEHNIEYRFIVNERTRLIYSGGRDKIVSGVFYFVAMRDIDAILKHPELNLNALKLLCEMVPAEEEGLDDFSTYLTSIYLERILGMLQRRESPLRTSHLEVSFFTAESLHSILLTLDSESLSSLTVESQFEDEERRTEIDWTAIVATEQFEGLTQLIAREFIMPVEVLMHSLRHISTCEISVKRLAPFSTFVWFLEAPRELPIMDLTIHSVEAIDVDSYDDFLGPPFFEEMTIEDSVRNASYSFGEGLEHTRIYIRYSAHNLTISNSPIPN